MEECKRKRSLARTKRRRDDNIGPKINLKGADSEHVTGDVAQ
jgi:hypothetical protein